MTLLGTYVTCHVAYLGISDNLLRNVVFHEGFAVPGVHLIQWLAPLENVAAVRNHLVSPLADLEIVRGCDGAGALFLLAAAILAFPASFRRKAVGLGLSIVLMYSLNLIRVSGLYFVIAYYSDWFPLIHTYLAPTLIILLACLFFAWWAFGTSRAIREPG